MKIENLATRKYLKKLSPNDAEKYINSFNLPEAHERLMYYLYVKKKNDILLAVYEMEKDKIFISEAKARRIHKECLDWITNSLKICS